MHKLHPLPICLLGLEEQVKEPGMWIVKIPTRYGLSVKPLDTPDTAVFILSIDVKITE